MIWRTKTENETAIINQAEESPVNQVFDRVISCFEFMLSQNQDPGHP